MSPPLWVDLGISGVLIISSNWLNEESNSVSVHCQSLRSRSGHSSAGLDAAGIIFAFYLFIYISFYLMSGFERFPTQKELDV